MIQSGITDGERYELKQSILSNLGYPQINIELTYSGCNYDQIAISGDTWSGYTGVTGNYDQVDRAINRSIQEMSSLLNRWSIQNHVANTLGLPADQDFTLRWVAQDYSLFDNFTKYFSEQVGLRGERELEKDYIVLSAGVQTYKLPSDRKVNDVLWHMPPQIGLHLVDPWNNAQWTNHEFGWAYMGHALTYMVPLWYVMLAAQQSNTRRKIFTSDYSYKIVKNTLYLYPVPRADDAGGMVWYFYYDGSDANRWSGQTRNSVVSSPGTMRLEQIRYDEYNQFAKHWVAEYSLAIGKEVLGRIRGKFSELPLPEGSVTMDGGELLSEGLDKQEKLRMEMMELLDSLNLNQLVEGLASRSDSLTSQLSRIPMMIYHG